MVSNFILVYTHIWILFNIISTVIISSNSITIQKKISNMSYIHTYNNLLIFLIKWNGFVKQILTFIIINCKTVLNMNYK